MDGDFLKMMEDLIDGAFGKAFDRNKEEKRVKDLQKKTEVVEEDSFPYRSVEDYTTKTGKKFRMTKDQKQRELTREDAFNETWRTN